MTEELPDSGIDPAANEPKTYGSGSLFLEKLDPPKADEPESFGSDHAGIEGAAAERSRSAQERAAVDVVQFVDSETGEVHKGDKITSPEYAADQLKIYREQKAEEIARHLESELASAVDQHRGQHEQPPVQQAEQVQEQPYEQIQPEAVPPETELERILAPFAPEQKLQIMRDLGAHIQQKEAQIEAAKQEHTRAAAQALLTAEAMLLSQVPELVNIPRENRPLALQMLETQNPQRAAAIRALDRQFGEYFQAQGQALQAAQQEQQRRHAEAFKHWAAAEDAKYDKFTAGQTATERAEISQEVMSILHEDGVTDVQAAFMWNNDPTFRSALSQKTLLREAKHRIAEREARRRKVVPVPRVIRPGVSEEPADRSRYAEMERSVRGRNLNAKEAAALLIARRAR